MEVLVFITVLEIKGLGRFAKTNAEHVVNSLHHLILHSAQLGVCLALFMGFSQDAGILAELLGHVGNHLARCRGGKGLRHCSLRNQAVFAYDCSQHIPLSAVI